MSVFKFEFNEEQVEAIVSALEIAADEYSSILYERLARLIDEDFKSQKQPVKLNTAWFTFGQCHVHSVNSKTFDKDIVVEITAADPRKVMFDTFGTRWGQEYGFKPNMQYFPRGIYKLSESQQPPNTKDGGSFLPPTSTDGDANNPPSIS